MSLLELMVGLVLGLMLMAGVMQVFLSSKQTNRFQDALSRIQENGRFAMDILESRLRMAGYTGCYGDLSLGVENILNDQSNVAWKISDPVQGFDNVATTDNLGGVTGFIAGTDVLVIRGMNSGVPLNSNPDTLEFTVTAANNRFAPGEILLVTDCDQASLFQATTVTTTSGVTKIKHAAGGMTLGNSVGNVNNRYGNGAEIGHLQTRMYSLQNGANGRPALWESRLVVNGGTTVSLVSQELVQTVLQYDPASTNWKKRWTSYVGGAGSWNAVGTYTTDSSGAPTNNDGDGFATDVTANGIQWLPNGAKITTAAQIVADSIVLPVSVTTSASCYGKAYYYLYRLTDGAYPDQKFYNLSGVAYEKNLILGYGEPTRVMISDMPGKDQMRGYGGTDQALDWSTNLNESFVINDAVSTRLMGWKEMRKEDAVTTSGSVGGEEDEDDEDDD